MGNGNVIGWLRRALVALLTTWNIFAGFGTHSDALLTGMLDLEIGGAMLTAQGSCSGTDFAYPSLRELFGERTVVFGLANGAIGYVIPDNDYAMVLDTQRHYHELLSLGEHTASDLFGVYMTLV